MRYLKRLLLVAMVFLVPATAVQAERVLRLNEVAVGELDPHIALDYIDSILIFFLPSIFALNRTVILKKIR